MAEPDDLYTLRQEFYVGNFQDSARLGLKEYDVIFGEVKEGGDTPIALQAVRWFAEYEAHPEQREAVVGKFQTSLQETATASCPSLQTMAAIIFLKEGLVKDALRAVHRGTTLEQRALMTAIYLRMDRLDHAQKQLKLMQASDEDATLTQMTGAWVDLAQGGTGYRDAQLLFQELVAKYGNSALLLNGLYEEADKYLAQCLREDPDKSNADTLINLIATAQHLHKPPETVAKLLSQLQKVAPDHPYVQNLGTLEGAFDRLQAQFASHIVNA
ncbi:coatomer subunit epsilon [Nannochloropsis gaditana CCMP526]|uniref:coatomer subunit epsilon n=1 Tax=Nannochloropsis gaditana (strain CCMP526) TaxID=1093141 RepID=UPI00029F6794|nr:coatomer subunit epsilon [Nannochloropsis gaditana CCMP526]EKU20929.1 coatomer subunit epsilon [Nannochloropsis gaditana CCMP526]|eukprot:XP_005855422.1 coatomer subunit epsilon [Nannochloropsis gaditana CCMP526]